MTTAQRLADAGYTHGATKDRCSSCAMCTMVNHAARRATRHCTENNATVSASGTCSLYLPNPSADSDLEDLAA